MHAGIVNWSLYYGKGGIERCANALAGAMVERGHAVTLFYNQSIKRQQEPVFPVPSGVATAGLELHTGLLNLDRARRRLREARLDVLVVMMSWSDFVWFPALLKGSGVPFLLSEHNSPEMVVSKWNALERMACMEAADHIHVLVQRFADTFPPEMRRRISVLPNPAKVEGKAPPRRVSAGRKILLGLGRFVEAHKQFSLLIRAFAQLAPRFADWDLRLCGDGESRADYVKLAEELGLEGRVQFPGMVNDVAAEYSRAEIFCMPSRVEGFPVVGVEAQHFGLPIVGFASCPGVNEIVESGENGLLADEMSEDALARALAELMADASLRERMSRRGRELLSRYEPEGIFDKWETLLRRVVENSRPTRIERIAKGETGGEAARELIGRAHPFDRRAYVAMHAKARATGEASPFTDKEIARYVRQMEWSCVPGYRLSGKCVKSLFRAVTRS